MGEKEYLTVKEFAAAANISNKAVYQQVKTRLKDYTKTIDDVLMISNEALERYYGGGSSCQVKSSQVDLNLERPEGVKVEDKYIKFLEQEIKDYKEQIKEKDKIIQDLQQQIISLSDKVIDMSNENLKQISSITKNIQLLQAAEVREDIASQETEIVEPPKKSFWDRLRGK